MLILNTTPERGLVRVSGEVPNGPLSVTRKSASTPQFSLRGGELAVTLGGFSLEDSEVPVNEPVTYTATSTPLNRVVARNLVRSPDFSYGRASWTTGANRTISTEGRIGANPAGSGSVNRIQRTIGEVGLGALQPNTQYLITGTLRFITPDVWTWHTARDSGTWQQVRAAKPTWEAVRSSSAGTGPSGSYTTVAVTLTHESDAEFIQTTQAIVLPMDRSQQWITFAVYVTTPAVIPAFPYLQILHGTTIREYAVEWELGQFSMMTRGDSDKLIRLFWFNGDTAVPERPQDYLMQDSEWEDVSGDAVIEWEGSPGTSVSRFLAPSVISTSATTKIVPPSIGVPCNPVLLSDPVSSAFGQWFGLGPMEPLTYAARLSILSVLDRSDYIGVSSKRALASGTFTLFTDTLAQRTQALRILQSGRVLLIRNPDSSYPESNWYIAIGDVQEARDIPDGSWEHRQWTIPFVQVLRPTGMIEASSGVTWQQLLTETWLQVRTEREDWLDVLVTVP